MNDSVKLIIAVVTIIAVAAILFTGCGGKGDSGAKGSPIIGQRGGDGDSESEDAASTAASTEPGSKPASSTPPATGAATAPPQASGMPMSPGMAGGRATGMAAGPGMGGASTGVATASAALLPNRPTFAFRDIVKATKTVKINGLTEYHFVFRDFYKATHRCELPAPMVTGKYTKEVWRNTFMTFRRPMKNKLETNVMVSQFVPDFPFISPPTNVTQRPTAGGIANRAMPSPGVPGMRGPNMQPGMMPSAGVMIQGGMRGSNMQPGMMPGAARPGMPGMPGMAPPSR